VCVCICVCMCVCVCVCVRERECVREKEKKKNRQERETAKDEKGISKAHERSRRNKRGKREISDKKATLWGGLCV